MNPLSLLTRSPDDTLRIGITIGRWLRSGDCLALDGPLGAGKTQLIKGVALGLEVSPNDVVVSPTFVLVREYQGCLRLFHADAYRLSGPEELLALGFAEFSTAPGAVTAVEWASRVKPAIPPSAIWIELEYAADPSERCITIHTLDPKRLSLLTTTLSPQ